VAVTIIVLFSDELLEQLHYIPSGADIWGTLVKPYDMGDEYSVFFSKFLGTHCKLAYLNANHPRYIQGPLPPLHCLNGTHPQTGLSDGAPYQLLPNLNLTDFNL